MANQWDGIIELSTENTVVPASFLVNNGQVTGLVGPDGYIPLAKNRNGVVLFGDSHWQFSETHQSVITSGGLANATVASHDNGTATITWNSFLHEGWPGAGFYIQGSTDPHWNGYHTVATRPSASSITFSIDPSATANLTDTKSADIPNITVSFTSRFGRANPFHMANAKSGQRMRLIQNLGANGEQPVDMEERFRMQVLPLNPGWVFYALGANAVRVGSKTGEVAAAETQAVLQAAKGMLPTAGHVFMNWLPDGASDPNYNSGATAKATIRFNELMRAWCAENDVIYFDEHQVMVDPTSTVGVARSKYLCTDDTHHSSLGGEKVAQKLSTLINSLVPPRNVLAASAADSIANDTSSKQKYRNPLFLTLSGGAGSLPSSVTVSETGGGTIGSSGSAARTVANDGDANGNNVVVAYTASADGDALVIEMTTTTTDFAAGDEIEACIHVRTSGMSGALVKSAGFFLYATVGGNTYLPRFGTSHAIDPSATYLTDDINEVQITPRFIVPSGTVTKMDFRLWWSFGGAGSQITVNVGCPSLRKVN